MLFLIDSNILIYAKMGDDDEQHLASRWLRETLTNKEHFVCVCETSILSFLRITTNKRIYETPLTVNDAKKFINDLLGHPGVRILRPLSGHYAELVGFMEKFDFTGNQVMDAHLAVLAKGRGAILVTRDEDFKEIPYLKKINPLAP